MGSGEAARNREPAAADPLLDALEDLVAAAADVDKAVKTLTARAAGMHKARTGGAQWRDIVDGEQRPLIAEILTDTIMRFESAGTRFRRAKARALHEEGMNMEQIAELFGVTRQRISMLLRDTRAPASPPAEEAGS